MAKKGTSSGIKIAYRRELAVSLRRAGYSYRDIASAIRTEINRANKNDASRYNHGQAYKDVMNVLDEVENRTAEHAVQLRRLTQSRLDELLRSVWERALEGDNDAVRLALQVMMTTIKLFSLDKIDESAAIILMQNNIAANNPFHGVPDKVVEQAISNMTIAMQGMTEFTEKDINDLFATADATPGLPSGTLITSN